MRLIGNKTRLLDAIEGVLVDRGIHGGTLIDVFSGTASVGRHFKKLGYRVLSNDRLSLCYTTAVAAVEVSRYPTFEGLERKYPRFFGQEHRAWAQAILPETEGTEIRGAGIEGTAKGSRRQQEAIRPLALALRFLKEELEPREGLIFRNYCPGGCHGRMYFSDVNGRRLDACLEFLRTHYRDGVLTRHEHYLLLSALIDAADRVANISGTYGAYLKRFQRNASLDLVFRLPEIVVSSKKHEAFQSDANEFIRQVRGDVLYVDPPYNNRQYAANYHVLEVIAEYHAIEDLERYEERLYGKTGLRPYDELRSAYCVPYGGRSSDGNVLTAMADLILSANVDSVLVSYSEEGLLTRAELGHILALFSGVKEYDFDGNMRLVPYKRFRSDSDHALGGSRGKRQYKVVEGREKDQVAEWLFYASRRRTSSSGKQSRAESKTPGRRAGVKAVKK